MCNHRFFCRILHCCVLFFYLLFQDVYAQNVMVLSHENGIHGQRTYNIIQDRTGFTWISTRFGVDRYDGRNIDHYTFDIFNHRKTGVPIESTHLLLDMKGGLWVHTDRVVYQYDARVDSFKLRFSFDDFIKTAAFDAGNRLWIGSRAMLVCYDHGRRYIVRPHVLRNVLVKRIIPCRNNRLLVVSDNAIWTLHVKTLRFEPLVNTQGRFAVESCVYDRKRNSLWVGDQCGVLRHYNLYENRAKYVGQCSFTSYPISALAMSDNHTLLVGTEGQGLFVYDISKAKVVATYNQEQSVDNRLTSNAILDIYVDCTMRNRIWVTTPFSGVNVIRLGEVGFKLLEHENRNGNTLCGNLVNGILRSGNDYVFCTDDGISLWNKAENRWKTWFEHQNILTAFKDRQGDLWVSVFAKGVYRLGNNGAVKQHFFSDRQQNSIGTNIVYAISQDESGCMWFGGRRGPITRYNSATGKFEVSNLLQVNKFLPMRDGSVLIACEQGVWIVPRGKLNARRTFINKHLQSTFINDMLLGNDSILWLATYGSGLNRCDLRYGTVRFFRTCDGLSSNIVQAIVRSDGRHLWYSSDDGIGKFDTQSYSVENYSITANHISSRVFRQNSGFMSADSTVFFGSHDGIVCFNPHKIAHIKAQGRLYFRDFKVANKSVKVGEKDAPLQTTIDKSSSVELNYKQNSVTIDFSAIDYTNGGNRLFSWKLEGIDHDWVEPTSGHVANYTNLSPGEYMFVVRYLSSNHKLIDQRSLRIVINPPFWDTLWARILELLLLAMIVYYVYYRVKTRIEKKQNEDRLRFFANISYNIRTPLTLIKSPIGELKNSLPSTSKTDYLLDLMSENVDKLTRLFSVFVGLHNAYNNAEQLQLSKVDISQLLLSKVEFFAVKAARRNLKLSTDKVVRNLEEWTDELKLQQIIDNLLAMTIEHASSDSLIAVGLACRTSRWSISFRAKCVPGQSRLRKLTTYDSTYLHQYIVLLNGDFSSKRHGDEITYSVSFYRGTEHYKNYVLLDSTEKTNILTDADISADVEVDRKYRPTLLVIEEDVDMGKVLMMSLADSYIVRIVTAGKNIWEEVVTVNPDIVICDLDMSEADGLDLCHRIKDSYETSHIAVVIMTMIDDSRVKQQAFNEGIDAYIEKPFDLDYLRSRINNIINNRNLLRRKFLGADNLQALVGSRKDDSVKRFMNNVQQILDKHLTDPKFSVNDFLIEMNLSRTLLYSKFRAVTGYAPNEFIKIMRMKKAVEYLNTHQYTINQISYMVGFEEPAYFSTCFKKVYGKSPRQFMDENGCGKVTDIADDMDES